MPGVVVAAVRVHGERVVALSELGCEVRLPVESHLGCERLGRVQLLARTVRTLLVSLLLALPLSIASVVEALSTWSIALVRSRLPGVGVGLHDVEVWAESTDSVGVTVVVVALGWPE